MDRMHLSWFKNTRKEKHSEMLSISRILCELFDVFVVFRQHKLCYKYFLHVNQFVCDFVSVSIFVVVAVLCIKHRFRCDMVRFETWFAIASFTSFFVCLFKVLNSAQLALDALHCLFRTNGTDRLALCCCERCAIVHSCIHQCSSS